MNKYRLHAILALALLLRLYHVASPTIGDNSWRQSDTAAMARNFYENGFNFFYPQIDWGGATAGYVETEFPIYPFLVALLYGAVGVHEFLGRLLSVGFAVLTIYVAFLLVRRTLGERVAMWSCLFLAIFPLNVFFGRNFVPEPMLILSIVLGLYFFLRWVETERRTYFFLSALFIALACLLKIPTLYIGLPLLYLAFVKYRFGLFRQARLWLYALLILTPVSLWYYHAHKIFQETGLTFGIWEYGTDKWGNWNLVVTWEFWNSILFQSLAERHFTWFGFPLMVAGLFIK